MPKRAIRQQSLGRRLRLDDAELRHLSEAAQRRLLGQEIYASAGLVAIYSPIQNEVATDLVAQAAWRSGRELAYPRVTGEQLEFCLVSEVDQLLPGKFGVLEPSGTEVVATELIDLLLVPGVAFDLRGHRLGYGKGFYDRLLTGPGRPRLAIGFAFEIQVWPALPRQSHDQTLDQLITEKTIRRF